MDVTKLPEYVMGTLCRICAERSSKLTPIFKDESFPQKILKCLSIEVTVADNLPLNICENCFFRVDESYLLYETALKSDQTLKKLWKILVKETLIHSSTVVHENARIENSHETEGSQTLSVPDLPKNSELVKSLDGENENNQTSDAILIADKAVATKFKDDGQKSILTVQHNSKSDEENSDKKDKLVTDQVKVVDEKYSCPICYAEFTTLAGLNDHATEHSQNNPFLCDICGKCFKHANNLRCHTKTHFGVKKKFLCKVCDKKFMTNFFLQEHMNSHTGKTPYKCPDCEKSFREKVHLRQHKWTHMKKVFSCPICGNTFNRKGNRNEHIKKYHPNHEDNHSREIKKSELLTINRNFVCSICTTSFSNQMLFKNHLKLHPEQKRFSCSLCGKKFKHSGSLTYHRRTAHTGEKPFQCNYCDKRFSLRSVQIIHERKIHTLERPYKCSVCLRLFTNSSSLRNHMLVHSQNKMYACDDCGKKFVRSSSLFVHKKLHTGERCFVCDCGKSYIQKHDLLKHKKIHDPKSKPFFCKYCGNTFSQKKHTAKHATCQFDYFRKNNPVLNTAENILNSITSGLEKNDHDFLVEDVKGQLF